MIGDSDCKYCGQSVFLPDCTHCEEDSGTAQGRGDNGREYGGETAGHTDTGGSGIEPVLDDFECCHCHKYCNYFY